MEAVVPEPVVREAFEGRRLTRSAERRRRTEAGVVDQDHEHVRRTLRRPQRLDRRERRGRILGVVRRHPDVLPVRNRQDLASAAARAWCLLTRTCPRNPRNHPSCTSSPEWDESPPLDQPRGDAKASSEGRIFTRAFRCSCYSLSATDLSCPSRWTSWMISARAHDRTPEEPQLERAFDRRCARRRSAQLRNHHRDRRGTVLSGCGLSAPPRGVAVAHDARRPRSRREGLTRGA